MKEEKFVFWDGSGKIVPHLLYRFLTDQGFGKYFVDDNNKKSTDPIIVKIKGNLVSEVNVGYLLETVNQYIEEYFKDKSEIGLVLDSLHKSTSLFGEKNLKFLPTLKLEFLTDTRDTAYFFFKNGVVQVNNSSKEVKRYEEFNLYIWENSIMNHDFVAVDSDTIKHRCEFNSFLKDITVVKNPDHANQRFNSLQSALGYLLHRYKDGTTTKAIILMDTYVDGQPNGRSGKTLAIKATGKIRKISSIDGKNFDSREWFSLSSVQIGTEVILFDDVKQNFNFEDLFPLTTEGLYLKRKYKDHVFIPHSKSPKVALTTNYAINGDSSSHKGRKFEFEISPTFSAGKTPRDKYGRSFFDEWNENDWNFFYNTMFDCLQLYLSEGLIESKPINMNLTKLINKTCEEFVEWAEVKISSGKKLDKKELFNDYLKSNPDYKSLRQREFTIWLREWSKYKNYKFKEGHIDDFRYVVYSY